MKCLRKAVILTLVVTFAFGPASSALAAPVQAVMDPCLVNPQKPGCLRIRQDLIQQAKPVLPNNPAPNRPAPRVHHHYYDSGATWGALAGGTMLGIVLGSMASQPRQDTQSAVVVVQQPVDDATTQQRYLELEIERERARVRALEEEIARLKAESKK